MKNISEKTLGSIPQKGIISKPVATLSALVAMWIVTLIPWSEAKASTINDFAQNIEIDKIKEILEFIWIIWSIGLNAYLLLIKPLLDKRRLKNDIESNKDETRISLSYTHINPETFQIQNFWWDIDHLLKNDKLEKLIKEYSAKKKIGDESIIIDFWEKHNTVYDWINKSEFIKQESVDLWAIIAREKLWIERGKSLEFQGYLTKEPRFREEDDGSVVRVWKNDKNSTTSSKNRIIVFPVTDIKKAVDIINAMEREHNINEVELMKKLCHDTEKDEIALLDEFRWRMIHPEWVTWERSDWLLRGGFRNHHADEVEAEGISTQRSERLVDRKRFVSLVEIVRAKKQWLKVISIIKWV